MKRIIPVPNFHFPKVGCCNCASIKRSNKTEKNDPPLSDETASTCCGLFREYCEDTTIHGIKYIGKPHQPRLDRWWWIIAILISVVLCFHLIHNLWMKWESSPVFVSFSEQTTPVWEIPFPAVTICSETKAQKSMFNYTDVYHRIYDAALNGTEAYLTPDELRNYEAITQVCDAHLSEFTVGNYTSDGATIFATLEQLKVEMHPDIFQCRWRNEFVNCSDILHPVLTEEGLCVTFNTLSADELLNSRDLHRDYAYVQHNNTGDGHWNLERGYSEEASHTPYPVRVLSAGARAGLSVLLPLYKYDLDYICRGPVQGFKIHLHTPGELPRVAKQYFRVPLNQEVIVAVKPNMITTSGGLRTYNPNRRQCYFNGERYLRFFRMYTQQNCEMECLANYTMTKCGCVKFSMPRDANTPVCGARSVTCYNQAEDDHLWQEFYDGLSKKESSFPHGGSTECNCLPACTSITYEAETSQADFDWENLFRAFKNPTEEFPGVQMARLSIYFKETQFITSKRTELYGPTDFLANCGGLLGLFMGVSLLSIIEILYYVFIRLFGLGGGGGEEARNNDRN